MYFCLTLMTLSNRQDKLVFLFWEPKKQRLRGKTCCQVPLLGSDRARTWTQVSAIGSWLFGVLWIQRRKTEAPALVEPQGKPQESKLPISLVSQWNPKSFTRVTHTNLGRWWECALAVSHFTPLSIASFFFLIYMRCHCILIFFVYGSFQLFLVFKKVMFTCNEMHKSYMYIC